MYLIVPALPQAATGDAVLLRPNQCRGPHFARSAKIRYWHNATGHGKASRRAELRNSEQGLTISRAAQTTELKLLQGELRPEPKTKSGPPGAHASMVLPTGQGLPENTSFNGFDALADGTLIAKTLYRSAGCTVQGPTAILPPSMGGCPTNNAPLPSILVSIDPQTLEVLDQVELDQFVAGRPTTAHFQGRDYVYLTTPTTAIRYLVKDGKFTLDESWNPGNIYQK